VPAVRVNAAPLAALNTFGIAATARSLWRIEHIDEVAPLVARLRADGEIDDAARRPLVLGGGSNLLIAGDLTQPVLQVAIAGRRVCDADDTSVIVEAGAGESWDALVRWTLAQHAWGLENLALIPGTVGASPIQNIGAYGVELRDRFDSLDAVDLLTGTMRRFDAAECAFAYRDSVFKQADGGRWMVVSVRLRLQRRPVLSLDYGEIRDELSRAGVLDPTPVAVADAVTAIRRRKLPDPAVLGNAGSFFKNPVVPPAQADALRRREPGLPAWPVGDQVKLSAAWMIDCCGWKGFRDGDAGVHAAHALVLVNHGSATGAQVLALARRVRDSVEARFGVRLQAEPVVVGAPDASDPDCHPGWL
jgi:UDP-N-acetylmuramate dehydrogenase